MDYIICNGTLVCWDNGLSIIHDAAVGIAGSLVAFVEHGGRDKDWADAFPGATIVDASGGLIIPGLINAHTHLPMTLFRGLADDLPLETWLNKHIFPAEAEHIDPDTVYAGALLGCAELLLAGVTTCCDGYFLEDSVARAAIDSGIRAVCGQGVIDFPAPGVPDPTKNIDAAISYLSAWKDRSDRIYPSVFCHSPYTCKPDTLVRAKEAARQAGVLFQVHVAETREELARTGCPDRSVISFLDRLGILDPGTLLVHAVWLDEKDIEIVAQRGCGVVHCPESNMKLASGIAPVPEMIDAGIHVALGTDGPASNNDLDIFSEMGMAARLHKVRTLDPRVMDASTVLAAATIDAASALGLGNVTGNIAPGMQADVVVLDTDRPHLCPVYHPESHLVYSARPADVKNVWVGGRLVVEDHKIITIDLGAAMARVRRMAEGIAKTNASFKLVGGHGYDS